MNAARVSSVVLALALAGCSRPGSEGDGSAWSPAPRSNPDDGPPASQCTDGDVIVRHCGNCGTMTSTCAGQAWSAFSQCTGQGPCAPGTQETAACGTDVGACTPGTSTRTCSVACEWEAWTACGGAYVGPDEEICANGIDEDCDGDVDEVCSSLFVIGPIAKLAASPGGALVYGLQTGSPSQVVVLDVASRTEVTRITLPQPADDLDLSPNGQHLVVAHDAAHQISKIDLATNTVQATKPVVSDPYRIEVDDAGVVYYVELDQWVDVRRVDATLASDTLLGSWALFDGDIELSPDGAFLYAGEAGLSGSSLYKYDVSGGGFANVDESTWDDGYGFPSPERHVYLGPDGQRVYYASHQLDAGDLAFTIGRTGKILAEDAAGTLAVGTREVRDARTLRKVGQLPRDAACATFANGDAELWYYHAATGRVFWVAKADLGDGALGERSFAPEPISSYEVSRLVRDPSRPRLYGLDPGRNLVVGFDADTLQPTGAILVGSIPTDLAVSPEQDALFVGHLDTLALARVDLAAFAFDRFLPVPRLPFEVEALSSTRIAFVDDDQWTTTAILDGATGDVVATLGWPALTFESALAAAAGGDALFVGDASLSGSNLARYDVSGGTFVKASGTTYGGGYGFFYPARSVVAVPDGTGVYYAGHLLHGENLAILLYAQPDPIRTVTPDGRLAVSATKVYRVSDGALLGTLPVSGPVQAVSPDGATLYVWTPTAISTVDLGAY